MTANQDQIETAARAAYITYFSGLADGFNAEAAWEDMGGSEPSYEVGEWQEVARAVIAAIHPTVGTVDELDALPVGTLGVDADGDGFYVGFYGACIVDYDPCVAPSPNLPATVLHIPGGAA